MSLKTLTIFCLLFSMHLPDCEAQTDTSSHRFSSLTPVSKHIHHVTNGFNKRTIDSTPRNSFIPPIKTNDLFASKENLSFQGGHVSYNMYYRENIDTPLLEKKILQNTVNGSLNLSVGMLPFRVNYLLRRSNSKFFRDINDVQIEFNILDFQKNIFSASTKNMLKAAESLKDTLAGKLGQLKLDELNSLKVDFESKFSLQKLIEARELLNLPELSWDITIPDSLAKLKSDSLKGGAVAYIKAYEKAFEKIERVRSSADSLTAIHQRSLNYVAKIQALARGGFNNVDQYQQLAKDSLLRGRGIGVIPAKYSWLFNVRKFSLGRSSLNHSELTAKNISVNGINLEYNSKYYFALSAGLLDFRFRDFNIQGAHKPKQYFFMGRVGVGNINKSYIILSLFKGQKRVFASGAVNNLYTVIATGISLEARYQLNKYGYLKGEVAESVAPDFRTNPAKNNKWNLRDQTDKAFAISSRFVVPQWQAKFEAMYKYTGANFQSFSNFQTNSRQNAWNVKAEKSFFKKQLRLTAAVKKNEFSNPYLIQAYQSNAVFTSLQAIFRKRNWPVFSGGFMPTSQLTSIGNNLIENRFNSLNATAYHQYRVFDSRAISTVMYSKFYNNNSDSSLLYFNSSNVFINQTFQFKRYNTSINITHSTNKNYELNVMDENIQVPIKKVGSLLFGVKINNLNRLETKLGTYGNLQLNILKNSTISFQYEQGYIPGLQGTLVNNSIGSIQVSKRF